MITASIIDQYYLAFFSCWCFSRSFFSFCALAILSSHWLRSPVRVLCIQALKSHSRYVGANKLSNFRSLCYFILICQSITCVCLISHMVTDVKGIYSHILVKSLIAFNSFSFSNFARVDSYPSKSLLRSISLRFWALQTLAALFSSKDSFIFWISVLSCWYSASSALLSFCKCILFLRM